MKKNWDRNNFLQIISESATKNFQGLITFLHYLTKDIEQRYNILMREHFFIPLRVRRFRKNSLNDNCFI
jgi:hypothetical protein